MLEVVQPLTRRERSAKIVITHEAHISTQIHMLTLCIAWIGICG